MMTCTGRYLVPQLTDLYRDLCNIMQQYYRYRYRRTESQHKSVIWGNKYLHLQVTNHHHRLAYALHKDIVQCVGQVVMMIGYLYVEILATQSHCIVSGFCTILCSDITGRAMYKYGASDGQLFLRPTNTSRATGTIHPQMIL